VIAVRSRSYDQRVSFSFGHGSAASRVLSCMPSAKVPFDLPWMPVCDLSQSLAVIFPSCQEQGFLETRVIMTCCSIAGCKSSTLAKGLCQKHYTRLRNNGDPEKVGKRGRPRDATKAGARETFGHWSRRKFERYWRARKAFEASIDPEK
jgi:hypothetical protein